MRFESGPRSIPIAVVAIVSLVIIPGSAFAPLAGDGDGHERRIEREAMHWLEPQVVPLDDFDADGPILAIGGGGESVIGQLKGEQVVAIDISRRELEAAPGDAIKIVMDARDLQFVDGSFRTAASFFTLMYIDPSDHATVLAEVHRVLRPGGRFLVWDATLGPVQDRTKEVVVVPLTVTIEDREISTGYGVAIPERTLDLGYYRELGQAAGFDVVAEREVDRWFYLELRKPR